MWSMFYFCKKLLNCLPKWLYHFAFLAKMNDSASSSTPPPASGAVRVWNFDHSHRCVVLSRCFNLHSPDDIWYGASFHILICHLYVLFGEVSVKVFGPFLSWFGSFLFATLLACRSSWVKDWSWAKALTTPDPSPIGPPGNSWLIVFLLLSFKSLLYILNKSLLSNVFCK